MGMVLITVAIQMLLAVFARPESAAGRTIAREITHDLPTADALRASEARFATILDTAVDAFVSINAAGIVEAFNPAAEPVWLFRR